MKIILSRKGFDLKYGGIPSPILPDGRMISFPIPSDNDFVSYKELKIDNLGKISNYYELLQSLSNNISVDGISRSISDTQKCHLDPDIYDFILKRDEYWRPIFGQGGAAQNHLTKNNVGINDIFLFFGTFQKTILVDGSLVYLKKLAPIHVIYGYFQIGNIFLGNQIKSDSFPKWGRNHPHYHYKIHEHDKSKVNCIYISNEKLTLNSSLPGADFFNFEQNLVLTGNNLSKSKWSLPSFFKEVNISYHSNNSWIKEGAIEYFKSADIGQEFVIEASDNIIKWIDTLITSNSRFA